VNIHPNSSPCIGVFDSGVGGLSILDALRQRLPHAPLTYVGDVAHAPYGERAPAEVIDRCQRIVGHLAEQGAELIVVACNTATVLAIESLRTRWPSLRFVGVEPGVKPAATKTRTRRIAIMTTSATATSARLQHLIRTFAPGVYVHIEPCPGLATAIERGALDGVQLHTVLSPLCANVRAAQVDTVVLGCTHYPFVVDSIQALLGNHIEIIDTARAVAERVADLWDDAATGIDLRVLSTGASAPMQALLERCRTLEASRVERLSI
jgi:glutamate racemase